MIGGEVDDDNASWESRNSVRKLCEETAWSPGVACLKPESDSLKRTLAPRRKRCYTVSYKHCNSICVCRSICRHATPIKSHGDAARDWNWKLPSTTMAKAVNNVQFRLGRPEPAVGGDGVIIEAYGVWCGNDGTTKHYAYDVKVHSGPALRKLSMMSGTTTGITLTTEFSSRWRLKLIDKFKSTRVSTKFGGQDRGRELDQFGQKKSSTLDVGEGNHDDRDRDK